MKICFVLLFSFLSYTSFAQNNYIVKTEDGRRVLLKADYTWEYIDAEAPVTQVMKKEIVEPSKENGCNLGDGFEEPKLNNKIQNQLKRGRATIDHIKAKVAEDYDCNVEDVLLLSVSEKKSAGRYTFCANGKKVFYKRTGHAILEKGKLF